MFKDDTYLESVLYRYKLGLDHMQMQQFVLPAKGCPGWRDRFYFSMGKTLIKLGSRLQQRCNRTAPTTYHPVYPAG